VVNYQNRSNRRHSMSNAAKSTVNIQSEKIFPDADSITCPRFGLVSLIKASQVASDGAETEIAGALYICRMARAAGTFLFLLIGWELDGQGQPNNPHTNAQGGEGLRNDLRTKTATRH
jgi:hypothetical protein